MNATNPDPGYFETPPGRALLPSAETLIQPPSGAALPESHRDALALHIHAPERCVVGLRANRGREAAVGARASSGFRGRPILNLDAIPKTQDGSLPSASTARPAGVQHPYAPT